MAQSREIRGLGAALAKLKEIDPKLEREARKRVKKAGEEIVRDARSAVPDVPLSGWVRNRAMMQDRKGQRTLRTGGGFPIFQAATARKRIGVTIKNQRVKGFTGRRRIVAIEQKDAAGLLVDMLGRKKKVPMGDSLSVRNGSPSRYMWPAAEGKINDVRDAMMAAIRDVEREMNRELRTRI